ncbi:AWPM-19-like family protein [Hibiscus syriacus]|uniref:AWPM-19-like family protein n=1 Tax=Hibiscus syriacus TaxID=106335 RepID=A0A6A2XNY4_HIBSY|nr:AWPM-19-like family protein [Hibiscus syriacus]
MELCVVGLHGQVQAGIDYLSGSQSSNGEPTATSVIVSGGYEDDQDACDTIIYTGHGGQDKFSRQCMHQKLEGGNLALERSMHYGIESGFGVYKYKLSRIDGQPEMGSSIMSDHDPMYYDYLANSVFPPYAFSQASNCTGCQCVSGCTVCSLKNGGDFAYDYNGFLLSGKPVIFECGNFCQCPPTCRNRVSQLGVVLTSEQAQIFSMNGDTLIYPNRFSERWTEWGNLSQIFAEYVHPSYPSIAPLDFAMDVSRMRNVACYISHTSRPNVLVQYVLFDHNNLMFPHLMLFAMENIPPMIELGIDYGMADEWTGNLFICN